MAKQNDGNNLLKPLVLIPENAKQNSGTGSAYSMYVLSCRYGVLDV